MTPPLIRLETVDSTNAWARQHPDRLGSLGAVYATSQTAGRGRLGRSWQNADGQALYYSCALHRPLAQPETLPLLASLVAADAIAGQFGADCAVKWPNDLLLAGKKLAGILCEGTGGGWIIGIGVNLAQPAAFFAGAGLPHATSLAAAGVPVPDPQTAADRLAAAFTDLFAARLPEFARSGFAPLRQQYCTRCINLGRRVSYQGGAGQALDVDDDGRLVVRDGASGEQRIFTGEVSVCGIYGAL